MHRILIADDADVGRSILRTLLRNEFDVVEARDGLEAVRLLQTSSSSPDLVILDLMMPGMDGLKVLAYMRDNHLLSRVPVLVLSAVSDSQDVVKCLEAGATDVLEKPFDPAVLRAKVHAAIRRQALLRDEAASPTDGFHAAILDAIPLAIFVEDPATRLVTYVNAAFRCILADPIGHPHSDLLPPEAAAAVNAASDDLLYRRIQRPAIIYDPDGNQYTVLFNALLDDTGTITHLIGTIIRNNLP